ncbi:glycosyltransferase [Providencia vermicola]|uniref:glycosyltransferase family 2 protein n=1 Tax=Providencia vermicola TaxID=333965 RepID=UPI0021501C8D|nr:glycosyltransferase family 2 protein [Providencia vermicola]MCR4181037.1 glycosyltransferase [Providencia vermicola]
MKHPFFSIITVTYNAEDTISNTLDSIYEQNNTLFELIIIDGKSLDNTLSIISKHPVTKNIVISEKDSGIYDAMNKGVQYAKGNYVVFMNSGDRFYDRNTLSNVHSELYLNTVDLYFGNTSVSYDNGNIKNKKCAPMTKGVLYTPVCHQSLYAKKELLIKHPFSSNYKIAADFNFILDVINDHGEVFISDKTLSIVSSNGISDIKRENVWLEYEKITEEKYGKKFFNWLFYRRMIVLERAKLAIKNAIKLIIN